MVIQTHGLHELPGDEPAQGPVCGARVPSRRCDDPVETASATAAHEWPVDGELAQRPRMNCLRPGENRAAGNHTTEACAMNPVARPARVPGEWSVRACDRHRAVTTALSNHSEHFTTY